MLRNYQKDAIYKVLKVLNKKDSVLLQMPTGTGKTTVFSEFVRKWISQIEPRKRVLILVHRKELVDQIITRLMNFGILAARIQTGYDSELTKQVQVGLIQSLNKPERLPKNISLIIIDEAHHTPANSYRKIIDYYSELSPKLFGLTATPCRLNGEGFEELFSKLITSDSIKDFIKKGYLAPIKHLSTNKIDLSNIRIDKKKGDYNERELESLLRKENIISDLIESYIKYGENKKTIVFALNKAHSIDIVERYIAKGISATYIDSDTIKIERDQIVNDFKKGKYQILCNVNIFTEGFDCPDVEVVQLARPTQSFSLYLQQIGRVMRPNIGKEYGLVIDNACLWEFHGLVTQDINWSLKEGILKNKLEKNKSHLILNNNSEVESLIPEEVIGVELEELNDVINLNNYVDFTTEEIVYIFNRFFVNSLTLEPFDFNNIEKQRKYYVSTKQKFDHSLTKNISILKGKDNIRLFNQLNIQNSNSSKINFDLIFQYLTYHYKLNITEYSKMINIFQFTNYFTLFKISKVKFNDFEAIKTLLITNGHFPFYANKCVEILRQTSINDINFEGKIQEINNYHLKNISSINLKIDSKLELPITL